MDTLLTRDKQAIWHPFTQLIPETDPLVVKSGKGAYLHTHDGREILDAISSWWVNLHGHSHPYIAKAVSKQVETLEHVIFAGFTHEPAIALAENLLTILPDNQSKIFYSDNGSTAVEVGLKMAFQYWYNQNISRKKMIAFNGAYHGDTFGAMSVGDRGPFSAPFSPYLFEVSFLDLPDGTNDEEVVTAFKRLIDSNEVGVFVFEPLILGSAGMKVYAPEVLDTMIGYAQKNGVICIADEVFTGFGRTGKYFASDYLTNKPDIFALSKGLTGGTMALGVTSCTAKVMEAFRSSDIMKTFFHGHSFTANPIACAAANASYELLIQSECWKNIQRIGEKQRDFAIKIDQHEKVKTARHLGTMMALEIDNEQDTSYVNEVRHKLYPYFLERDILLRPLGNVVYILPPYIIEDADLDRVYHAVEEMLGDL